MDSRGKISRHTRFMTKPSIVESPETGHALFKGTSLKDELKKVFAC